jgi:hypothetical protein
MASNVSKKMRSISDSIGEKLKEGNLSPSDYEAYFLEIEELSSEIKENPVLIVAHNNIHPVLVTIGERAFPLLDDAYEFAKTDSDQRHQQTIIKIYGQIGNPSLSRIKNILLTAKHHQVRNAAGFEIIKLDQGIETGFRKYLSPEYDFEVRKSIISGIRIAFLNNLVNLENAEIYKEELLSLLEDDNEFVRSKTVGCISQIWGHFVSQETELENPFSYEDMVEITSKSLGDDQYRVRDSGMWLLRQIKLNKGLSVLLVRAIEDSNAEISKNAIDFVAWSRFSEDDISMNWKTIFEELIVRTGRNNDDLFNPQQISSALSNIIETNPTLYSKTLNRLCDLAFMSSKGVRRRAVLTAKRINKEDFETRVYERYEDSPEIAKKVLRLLGSGDYQRNISSEISKTDPADVQKNAANQIALIESFYNDARSQAKTSFGFAVGFAIVGLVCLLASIYFIYKVNNFISIITTIGSVLSQFISGTILYLYNQTRKQLIYYHLDSTSKCNR